MILLEFPHSFSLSIKLKAVGVFVVFPDDIGTNVLSLLWPDRRDLWRCH